MRTHFEVIAALDAARAIGYQGQLPWHLPDDLRRFYQLTKGNVVVMGRKTRLSLGERGLPGRTCFVLSSSPCGDRWVRSTDELEAVLDGELVERAFIIGGVRLFEYAIDSPRTSVLHLTRVPGKHAADVFFPSFEHRFQLDKVDQPVEGHHCFETWRVT